MNPNNLQAIQNPRVRIILILLFALILRLAIFSDLKPSGTDPITHLLLAREIMRLGIDPMFHIFYLPGVPWIYPPFFHAVLALLLTSGAPPLETTLGLGLAVDVFFGVPIFVIATRLGTLSSGTLAAILFAVDTSNIYPLTWGGYPNLMASIFIGLGVFALTIDGWRSVILLTTATIAIGLTHYLSLAVWVAILLLFIALDLAQRNWSRLFQTTFALLVGAIPLAYWYVPRVGTYLALISTGPNLEAYASGGLLNIAAIYLLTFGIGGLLLIILPLTLFQMPWRENQSLYAWALAPLALSVPFIQYPNIVIRLAYFSMTPSAIAFSIVAMSTTHRSVSSGPLTDSISNISKKYAVVFGIRKLWIRRRALIILAILALSTSQAIYLGGKAHSYYKTYTPDVVQLANWFSSNADPSKTLIANLVPGLYVAALSPRPVIFAANETWFSLVQERDEIKVAFTLLYSPPTAAGYASLVCKYSVGYLVYDDSLPSWYPGAGNEMIYVVGPYFIVELHPNC